MLAKEDAESKLLALKVISQLGKKDLLEDLKPIISDRESSQLHRIQAIRSTQGIAKRHPSLVRENLNTELMRI